MNQVVVVSSVLLWVAVLLNFLLTLALIRRLNMGEPNTGSSAKDGPPLGQMAPDFSAETLQGETVTLANYTGRAVAYVFVSPTCGPCREMVPQYEALAANAARANVSLVLVSAADTAETQAFADEFKIRLPVLVAPPDHNPFIKDYNIPGTPFYCFIDADGKVQARGYPSMEWGKWKTLTTAWATAKPHFPTLALNTGR